MKYFVTINGRTREVQVVERLGALSIHVDGQPLDLHYEEVDNLGQVAILHAGKSYALSIEGNDSSLSAVIAGHLYAVEIEDERERAAHAAETSVAKGGGTIKSVMPGVVVKLLAKVGDSVEKGQPLLILEAMKMQNEIVAPGPGVVKSIHVAERDAVSAGTKLITLQAPPS